MDDADRIAREIGSAPKDGRRILLWGDSRLVGYVPVELEPDWHIGLWNERGWFDGEFDDWIYAPTHWCPLPARIEK